MSTDGIASHIPKRRLDAFETIFQVAQLTLRRSLRGWRIWLVALVALIPCGLAALVRWGGADAAAQTRLFFSVLSYFHFGIAVPVAAMLFATAFPWPESNEGTLTYWFTSPVRRWTVLAGRYAAALVLGLIVLTVTVTAVALPLTTQPEADVAGVTRSAIAATLLVYPAYLAVFQLVAVVFRFGIVFGVVFVFLENLIAQLSGAIVQMTLIYYVRSMMLPSIPQKLLTGAAQPANVDPAATPLTSILVFGSVTAVALGLSLLLVEVIEYRGRTSQAA